MGGWRLCCIGAYLPLARYPKRVPLAQNHPSHDLLLARWAVAPLSQLLVTCQRRRWMTGGR